MAKRIVEITAPSSVQDSLIAAANQFGAEDVFTHVDESGGRCFVRVIADNSNVQKLVDATQNLIGKGADWRLVILPVEAVVPAEIAGDGDTEAEAARARFLGMTASREEIMQEVVQGSHFDVNFIVLVILSTVAAAIGLLSDNVAVVIGAMVIAPLLGPNLAFAFGTALGDRGLMTQAMLTNLVGISLTVGLGLAIGWFWSGPLDSHELLSRTEPTLAGVALALAAGGAAVLSLTTGLSSALVGVMVAVALMPPAVVAGIMLGVGRFDLALGAVVLLAVNVVCVNLAAQAVFVAKGIQPRTWYEKQVSRTARLTNLAMWIVLLALLIAAIAVIGQTSA